MNSSLKCFLAIAVAATSLLPTVAIAAPPFVRTETCGPTTIPCKPQQRPIPIVWPNPCLIFFVNENGSKAFSKEHTQKALPKEALDAVIRGFLTWNDVPGSRLKYYFGGLTNENDVAWHSEINNVNAILWRDKWPNDLPRAIALTSVSYSPSTGEIVDADVEINTSPAYLVTYSDDFVSTDLQNSVTHEAGHFLGLAHTLDVNATMFGKADAGEIKKRTLNNTDIIGVRSIYPDNGKKCRFPEGKTFYDVTDPKNLKPIKGEDGGCCSSTSTKSTEPITSILLFGLVILITRPKRQEKNLRK